MTTIYVSVSCKVLNVNDCYEYCQIRVKLSFTSRYNLTRFQNKLSKTKIIPPQAKIWSIVIILLLRQNFWLSCVRSNASPPRLVPFTTQQTTAKTNSSP